MAKGKNVLGGPLKDCSHDPLTGWFRSGCCDTDEDDHGVHTVCAIMTQEFLDYTRSRGNDLSTRTPFFPGLQPGDQWCVCAGRWVEALRAGVAPPIVLEATHEKTLELVSLAELQKYQFKIN